MRKIFFAIIVILLVNAGLVFAHERNFTETKQLIDSGISCEKLTDEQLESLGDYYMEQMHPGEAHELMDNMMGGEGSESLKQVHINMAKRLYCNENTYIGYGMMGSGGMMGMMNMMSGGMMGSYPASYGYSTYGYGNILWMLFFAAVIFLIALIIAWIIRRFGIKNTASETPLTILRKRFVKGEITKKEFEGMKKEIGE